MVTEVKKYATGISIGMRFGPSFSLCDESGSIVDYLLYTEGSYFNKEMFPRVSLNPFQVRVENPETGDYLSISQQDIVLNCNFSDTIVEIDQNMAPIIRMEDISDINENFQIFLDFLKELSIDRIKRLGYINRYVFDIPDLTNHVLKSLTSQSEDMVRDIHTRFSKKYPVPESMVKRDINNYHNVIYTVEKKIESDDLEVSIDYQEMYEPNLEETSKIDIKKFLEKMERYNLETFPRWLAKVGE